MSSPTFVIGRSLPAEITPLYAFKLSSRGRRQYYLSVIINYIDKNGREETLNVAIGRSPAMTEAFAQNKIKNSIVKIIENGGKPTKASLIISSEENKRASVVEKNIVDGIMTMKIAVEKDSVQMGRISPNFSSTVKAQTQRNIKSKVGGLLVGIPASLNRSSKLKNIFAQNKAAVVAQKKISRGEDIDQATRLRIESINRRQQNLSSEDLKIGHPLTRDKVKYLISDEDVSIVFVARVRYQDVHKNKHVAWIRLPRPISSVQKTIGDNNEVTRSISNELIDIIKDGNKILSIRMAGYIPNPDVQMAIADNAYKGNVRTRAEELGVMTAVATGYIEFEPVYKTSKSGKPVVVGFRPKKSIADVNTFNVERGGTQSGVSHRSTIYNVIKIIRTIIDNVLPSIDKNTVLDRSNAGRNPRLLDALKSYNQKREGDAPKAIIPNVAVVKRRKAENARAISDASKVKAAAPGEQFHYSTSTVGEQGGFIPITSSSRTDYQNAHGVPRRRSLDKPDQGGVTNFVTATPVSFPQSIIDSGGIKVYAGIWAGGLSVLASESGGISPKLRALSSTVMWPDNANEFRRMYSYLSSFTPKDKPQIVWLAVDSRTNMVLNAKELRKSLPDNVRSRILAFDKSMSNAAKQAWDDLIKRIHANNGKELSLGAKRARLARAFPTLGSSSSKPMIANVKTDHLVASVAGEDQDKERAIKSWTRLGWRVFGMMGLRVWEPTTGKDREAIVPVAVVTADSSIDKGRRRPDTWATSRIRNVINHVANNELKSGSGSALRKLIWMTMSLKNRGEFSSASAGADWPWPKITTPIALNGDDSIAKLIIDQIKHAFPGSNIGWYDGIGPEIDGEAYELVVTSGIVPRGTRRKLFGVDNPVLGPAQLRGKLGKSLKELVRHFYAHRDAAKLSSGEKTRTTHILPSWEAGGSQADAGIKALPAKIKTTIQQLFSRTERTPNGIRHKDTPVGMFIAGNTRSTIEDSMRDAISSFMLALRSANSIKDIDSAASKMDKDMKKLYGRLLTLGLPATDKDSAVEQAHLTEFFVSKIHHSLESMFHTIGKSNSEYKKVIDAKNKLDSTVNPKERKNLKVAVDRAISSYVKDVHKVAKQIHDLAPNGWDVKISRSPRPGDSGGVNVVLPAFAAADFAADMGSEIPHIPADKRYMDMTLVIVPRSVQYEAVMPGLSHSQMASIGTVTAPNPDMARLEFLLRLLRRNIHKQPQLKAVAKYDDLIKRFGLPDFITKANIPTSWKHHMTFLNSILLTQFVASGMQVIEAGIKDKTRVLRKDVRPVKYGRNNPEMAFSVIAPGTVSRLLPSGKK